MVADCRATVAHSGGAAEPPSAAPSSDGAGEPATEAAPRLRGRHLQRAAGNSLEPPRFRRHDLHHLVGVVAQDLLGELFHRIDALFILRSISGFARPIVTSSLSGCPRPRRRQSRPEDVPPLY